MIIHVYADQKNIGDLLSAQGIKKGLRKTDTKDFIIEKYMRSYPDDWFKIICEDIKRIATQNDLIVIGGGGLFHNCFEKFWIEILSNRPISEIFLWGVGVCEIKDEETLMTQATKSLILANTTILSVRDDRTSKWLNAAKTPRVIGCPSLNHLVGHRSKITRMQKTKIKVLYVKHQGLEKNQEQEISNEVSRLAIKHDFQVNYIDNIVNDSNSLSSLQESYRSADLILTSRLHGCIIGYAMNKRILAISNDFKIDEFMGLIGLSANVLSIDRFLSREYNLREIIDRKNSHLFYYKSLTWNFFIGIYLLLLHRKLGHS
jgi:polysaccharide pyruvyl transferase WcaK-like protein